MRVIIMGVAPLSKRTPAGRSDMPARADRSDFLPQFISRYRVRTRTSRRIAISSESLADSLKPLTLDHTLKAISYPIFATRCGGSRFEDADSNEYVDFCMGFGSALFGHTPSFLQRAIREQTESGFTAGPQSELAVEVAGLIAGMTGMERVAFACSGTEAVMLAIRLARTVTFRDRIAFFTGSYHGQYDATLAVPGLTGVSPQALPMAPGIPPRLVEGALVLPYGADESLAVICQHRDQLAAVLVEPLQSRQPGLSPRPFLQELRKLTADADIALVFDEMITGFRLAPGGAQAWFGIPADLAIYGKVLSGGLPLAAVAGTTHYMNAIDGGAWKFAESDAVPPLCTFSMSSFARNPLILAAARAVLLQLRRRGPRLQNELNRRTAALTARINSCLDEEDIPLRWASFGSFFGPAGSDDSYSPSVRLLHYLLAERGFFLWGASGFLSSAHTSKELDNFFSAFRQSFQCLKRAGMTPAASLD
jgi:glutamate-1-semialdehyde 2,1-aminomutase